MNLENVISMPMDNSTITQYLKNAKIMTNKDLLNYNNIEEVFNPANKKDFIDYVIILFLDAPNSGHWTALNRMGSMIEFFDSYGQPPKEVYKYCPMEQRKKLNTQKDYLCTLLNKYDGPVVYNSIKYQEDKKDVNTCGRHCCYRIINMFGRGYNLDEYYNFMKYAKEKLDLQNYDEVVSELINL